MPNEDPQMPSGERQRLGIPNCLRCILTAISALLIFVTSVSIVLFVVNKKSFPAPEELESSFLLALAIGVLLVLYVPWQRISIAGVEIERELQEQAKDFREQDENSSKQIERLQKENAELRKNPAELQLLQKEQKQKEQEEMLILKFLNEWSSWGFTPLRIKNRGGKESGYEELGKLSTSRIRVILSNLVADGMVRLRVSRNGNILYQAR